jgi:hypothetical protein
LKDSLPTNDPAKVIKGAEFSTEFTAIQTAFGQAAPIASPTFTGTVTISSVDINGGTIDGVTIGGSSAGAITGTTGQFNTSLNVDGTVTADGLTVDLADNAGVLLQSPNDSSTAFLKFGDSTSSDSGSISYDHFTDSLRLKTVNTNRLVLASNGDISFYEETGTTPALFWDASEERLGIGTTSPNRLLDIATSNAGGSTLVSLVSATDGNCQLLFGDTSSDTQGKVVYNNSGDYMALETNGSERVRIDSSGNALIGTTAVTGSLSNAARVTGGIFSTNNGTTSVPNATWTTLATIPTGDGIYLVTAYLPSSGDPGGYNAVSIVTTSLTGTNLTDIKNANHVALRMSGSNLQVNHGQGTTQPINWSILRLA